MGRRRRRSRSISPPRARHGPRPSKSPSNSSDYPSSSAEEKSREKKRRRRSRSRSPASSRRHHRRERSRSGSRDARRSRNHRRSRSRERRRETHRSRSRDRRSRSRDRARDRRHGKAPLERQSEKASSSTTAKQQVEKLREQRKAALKQAEKTDDALREQFEERYYRDGDKVRWERFGGNPEDGADDEKAMLAEVASQQALATATATAATDTADAAAAATNPKMSAVPPPTQALETVQRQTAIEAIDNPKFSQKAFVSNRLGVDAAAAAAKSKSSTGISAELKHEAAMFGSTSNSSARFDASSLPAAGAAALSTEPESLWSERDGDGAALGPVTGELLDVSASLKKERWAAKLHQMRLEALKAATPNS